MLKFFKTVNATPTDGRFADAAGLGTSVGSKKRMKYDTSIRDTLQRMVPTGSSPAVAVSILILTITDLYVSLCLYT
jgi:hypothetical protein